MGALHDSSMSSENPTQFVPKRMYRRIYRELLSKASVEHQRKYDELIGLMAETRTQMRTHSKDTNDYLQWRRKYQNLYYQHGKLIKAMRMEALQAEADTGASRGEGGVPAEDAGASGGEGADEDAGSSEVDGKDEVIFQAESVAQDAEPTEFAKELQALCAPDFGAGVE